MPRRRSDSTPRHRLGYRFDLKSAPRHPVTGALVSSKQELKRDLCALYREEHGHDPSPRQLKRWIRLQNRTLPRTDVLGSGGEAA